MLYAMVILIHTAEVIKLINNVPVDKRGISVFNKIEINGNTDKSGFEAV
jgi:hypothetical protein